MDDKVVHFKTKHCPSFKKERAKELIGKPMLRENKTPNCKTTKIIRHNSR